MKNKLNLRRQWRRALLASIGGGLLSAAGGLHAAEPAADSAIQRLRQLSLEELLNLEVSTVSKKEQRVSDAAAAVSVLTGDDIRRSGVTHIAEALRFVPGVQVARLNAHQWGISVRGFNEIFANKLLVMVDGRSVYTPLFSGTLWEYQDLPLESVERIEVVRGPGASVWGANAVNGVINVITKSAKETQGGHIAVGGGDLDQFITTASYGAALSDEAWLRLDMNYRQTAEMENIDGVGNGDDVQSGTGRLRLDWEPSDTSTFTLIGGGQYSEFGQNAELLDLSIPGYVATENTVRSASGNILGRWTRTLSEASEIELQSYLDYSDIDSGWIHDQRMNFDVELNHRWQAGERHNINWGLGYRLNTDHITTSGDTIYFAREDRSVNLFSGFIQDDVQLVPDVLSATAGVRLEHNGYTGFAAQPTLRGLWKLADHHSVWGSVSRAVRTPSRAENDSTVNVSFYPPGTYHPLLPTLFAFSGSEDFASEDLWAFELGYRWLAADKLHFDATGFYNVYDQLRGNQPGAPYLDDPLAPSYLVVPLAVVNDTSGDTWGGELSAVWQALDDWRLRLGYSYLGMAMQGSDAADVEGWSPKHQLFVQSQFQLTKDVELDANVRYVDELSGPGIPAYVTADVRVGWKPRADLELSIVGQNLFDSPHQEFQSTLINYTPSVIARSFFGKITWSF